MDRSPGWPHQRLPGFRTLVPAGRDARNGCVRQLSVSPPHPLPGGATVLGRSVHLQPLQHRQRACMVHAGPCTTAEGEGFEPRSPRKRGALPFELALRDSVRSTRFKLATPGWLPGGVVGLRPRPLIQLCSRDCRCHVALALRRGGYFYRQSSPRARTASVITPRSFVVVVRPRQDRWLLVLPQSGGIAAQQALGGHLSPTAFVAIRLPCRGLAISNPTTPLTRRSP